MKMPFASQTAAAKSRHSHPEVAPEQEVSLSLDKLKSPGSLLGSSLRSDQVSTFDSDDNTSMTSWRIGMPWLGNHSDKNHPHRTKNGGVLESPRVGIQRSQNKRAKRLFLNNNKIRSSLLEENHNRYYGGIMKANSSGSSSNRTGNSNTKKQPTATHQSNHHDSAVLSSSSPLGVPRSRSKDSIADFDESEWTPQDSSYGAACPVCGCIPKHVRRAIEFTMISTLLLAFVYLLVVTSINVSDARASRRNADDNYHNISGTTKSNYNALTDDDLYVEYKDAKYNDDDVVEGNNRGDDYYTIADDDNNNKNDDDNVADGDVNDNYVYNYNNADGANYQYYYYNNNNNGGGGDDDGGNNNNNNNYQYDNNNGGRHLRRVRRIRR